MTAALPALPLDIGFATANTLALAAWFTLIFLPRHRVLRRVLQTVVIGGLCVAYTSLVMVFFTSAAAGYGTLVQVQRLFTVPEVALAGWLHYLAFDLFVGLWIAQHADQHGVARMLQAPVLLVTFMFGPVGLLLYGAIAWRHEWLYSWLQSGPSVNRVTGAEELRS